MLRVIGNDHVGFCNFIKILSKYIAFTLASFFANSGISFIILGHSRFKGEECKFSFSVNSLKIWCRVALPKGRFSQWYSLQARWAPCLADHSWHCSLGCAPHIHAMRGIITKQYLLNSPMHGALGHVSRAVTALWEFAGSNRTVFRAWKHTGVEEHSEHPSTPQGPVFSYQRFTHLLPRPQAIILQQLIPSSLRRSILGEIH